MKRLKKLYSFLGPLIGAAFSLFCSAFFLQKLFVFFGSDISILSEKNVGKIVFTLLVFVHLDLFLRLQNSAYVKKFYETVFGIWGSLSQWVYFLFYFCFFFFAHVAVILVFVSFGYAELFPAHFSITLKTGLNVLWGLAATFFLVWTEESIFRVALFGHIRRHFSRLPAVLLSAFFFMSAHGLQDPYRFFLHEWRIALGLFCFGLMLQALYNKTGNILASMGAHAGIVFVKVLQRKTSFVTYLSGIQSIWLIDSDLRQSLLAQLLFFSFFLLFYSLPKE